MFGVDQCRVCGKPITIRSPKSITDQEQALRKPVVPEKVWRARGYLTAPTPQQWYNNPADGCCGECGRLQLRKHFRSGFRVVLVPVILIGLGILVTAVMTFMPH